MRYVEKFTQETDYTTKRDDLQMYLKHVCIVDPNDDSNYDIHLDPNFHCIVFTSMGTSTVALSNTGDNAPVLEYSRTGLEDDWETWDYSALTINKDDNDTMFLFLRGRNTETETTADDGTVTTNPATFSQSSTVYSKFVFTGSNVKCDGNIMYLINDTVTELTHGYEFYSLFNGCTLLQRVPELPATTLSDHCYSNMFQGCTALKKMPKLPATTLASYCYNGMFAKCTSLKSAANLTEATTLASNCYNSMFYHCTGLLLAPALPCMTLAASCYYGMFCECTSLEVAPELPATTLSTSCYSCMFQNCSKLKFAYDLPATSAAASCYSYMFNGTALTIAPNIALTSSDENCCQFMFCNCTKLIKGADIHFSYFARQACKQMYDYCIAMKEHPAFPAVISEARYACQLMFRNCKSITKLPTYKINGLVTYSNNSMYTGCSSLTDISGLTIYGWCGGGNNSQCLGMFENCTSLVDARGFSITGCSWGGCNTCFYAMFGGCTSLKYPPVLSNVATGYWPQNMYQYLFRNCTALEEFSYDYTDLSLNSLNYMFQNCTSLKWVRFLFTTDISSDTRYTLGWMTGVPAGGVFVKNIKATWECTGVNGVPEGWTVIYYDTSDKKYYIDQEKAQECDKYGNII